MKLLVLGATGLLGHALCRAAAGRIETFATVRGDAVPAAARPFFAGVEIVPRVTVEDPASVTRAFDVAAPDAVVNAIGQVKPLGQAVDVEAFVRTNALFPHELARRCRARGARLVHVSTDCVFSGRRGGYAERDEPDAGDLYGLSKRLGEIVGPDVLTIRTSMIGRELAGSRGLVEWLLAQPDGPVPGYRRAVFSGLTTAVLAGWIVRVVREHAGLAGLRHVAAEPITKLDLLRRLSSAFGRSVRLEPVDEPVIDRSLDGRRFAAETGLVAPSWDEMIDVLRRDADLYEPIRSAAALEP